MRSRDSSSGRARASAALLLAAGLGACASPQRVPGPMPLPAEVEGAAEEAPAGEGAELTVVRHSDEVAVQYPGAPAGSRLTYWRKRARLSPGGRVITSAAGRAELLWPGDSSSVVMMGAGVAAIGDPRRDEPFVRFLEVSRALLQLTPEDRVELPGGAILRGDPAVASGPFSLELVAPEILRVRNQSTLGARIAYRAALLDLGPGDEVDLPLLASGTAPRDPDPAARRVETGIVDFVFTGRVEWTVVDGRIRVRAEEASELEVLGLRVRLAPGEEILLGPPENLPRLARVRG
ncbi:MAG: hypothetical protein AB1726_06910 [Planctomycetota bacterium]